MGKQSSINKYIDIENPKFLRKIFIIKLFGLIGILFTFPLGVLALINGNYTLSFTLIIIAILLGTNYFVIAKKLNYALSANIIVYLFLVLFIYLVYSGGVSHTGTLWIYTFPALALFLHGLKHGLIDIAIFVSLLILMFVLFDSSILEEHYSTAYKLRLILSFLVVTFLSSLYEYSNAKFFDEMQLLTEKLINVAKEDQLSELVKKRGIHEEMECLYQEAKMKSEPMCVMLCDIDYLHDINNRYGHEVGDMVIKEIVTEIQNSIKNSDTLSIWSGEEFLILLPKTELHDAYNFARALEKRIENLEISYDRHPIQLSLSIGISNIEHVKSIYAAVRHADNAMYKVKKGQISLA